MRFVQSLSLLHSWLGPLCHSRMNLTDSTSHRSVIIVVLSHLCLVMFLTTSCLWGLGSAIVRAFVQMLRLASHLCISRRWDLRVSSSSASSCCPTSCMSLFIGGSGSSLELMAPLMLVRHCFLVWHKYPRISQLTCTPWSVKTGHFILDYNSLGFLQYLYHLKQERTLYDILT